MKNRIELIGTGSAQFGYGTMGDFSHSKVLHGSHIILLDTNPEAVGAAGNKTLDFIEEHTLPPTKKRPSL